MLLCLPHQDSPPLGHIVGDSNPPRCVCVCVCAPWRPSSILVHFYLDTIAIRRSFDSRQENGAENEWPIARPNSISGSSATETRRKGA